MIIEMAALVTTIAANTPMAPKTFPLQGWRT